MWGGGGEGEEEERRRRRIIPHYRSVGRRQGSCGVFGGCSALSADLANSNAFIIKFIGRHLRRYKMGRRGEEEEDTSGI